tara:strand:- start:7694 stop:8098 length:405 start_codon:yes stop_codon:yes gene_type:complete
MASNKNNNKLVLTTFITELSNFIELLTTLLPDSKEIEQNKTYFISCKKMNPRAIIISWKTDIADHFKTQIENNDINFFANHNFQNDVFFKDYSSFIVKMLENLKHNINNLNNDNKTITMKYIQNLSKISNLYIC